MGNRHPLKAAKIGQITGGWAGVKEKKRRGGGTFSSRLPIRVLKAAAPSHNFRLRLLPVKLGGTSVLTLEIKLKLSTCSCSRGKTSENVTNSGLDVTQRLTVKQTMG